MNYKEILIICGIVSLIIGIFIIGYKVTKNIYEGKEEECEEDLNESVSEETIKIEEEDDVSFEQMLKDRNLFDIISKVRENTKSEVLSELQIEAGLNLTDATKLVNGYIADNNLVWSLKDMCYVERK